MCQCQALFDMVKANWSSVVFHREHMICTPIRQVDVLHSEPVSVCTWIPCWRENIIKWFLALIEMKFGACVNIPNVMLTKIYNNPFTTTAFYVCWCCGNAQCSSRWLVNLCWMISKRKCHRQQSCVIASHTKPTRIMLQLRSSIRCCVPISERWHGQSVEIN